MNRATLGREFGELRGDFDRTANHVRGANFAIPAVSHRFGFEAVLAQDSASGCAPSVLLSGSSQDGAFS
jgi:hypothetical protein